MSINRALNVLAKKFSVSTDIFKPCTKNTIINWAKGVDTSNALEKKTGEKNLYRLNRHQHAFLIGDFRHIPTVGKIGNYEF